MRELKFRVYIPDHEKLCYFDLGNFDYSDRYLDQKEYPVQQFTGTKDSKGVDVYEGDRVRYKLNKKYFFEKVKWEHNGWMVVNEKDDSSFPLITELEDFEVIGNIHELPCNPDHNGECLVCDEWLTDCPFGFDKNKE